MRQDALQDLTIRIEDSLLEEAFASVSGAYNNIFTRSFMQKRNSLLL